MTKDHLRAPSNSVQVLKDAVKNWPRTEPEKKHPFNSAIAAYISSDFENVDFASDIADLSAILSIDGSETRKVIVFDDVDGFRYRAILVVEGDAGWRIGSIKVQCPVCFGDGVNDDRPCTICGGSGWGVTDK